MHIFPGSQYQQKKTGFNKPIKKPKIVWIQPGLWCEIKYLELDHFGVMLIRRLKDCCSHKFRFDLLEI